MKERPAPLRIVHSDRQEPLKYETPRLLFREGWHPHPFWTAPLVITADDVDWSFR